MDPLKKAIDAMLSLLPTGTSRVLRKLRHVQRGRHLVCELCWTNVLNTGGIGEFYPQIKCCLNICAEHPECSKSKSALPRRVIDTAVQRRSDSLRIVESGFLSSELHARYAALSYYWGDKNCTLTSENMASHKRHLSLRRLPKTVRDAVEITRRIGIHSLWVDALCIV